MVSEHEEHSPPTDKIAKFSILFKNVNARGNYIRVLNYDNKITGILDSENLFVNFCMFLVIEYLDSFRFL